MGIFYWLTSTTPSLRGGASATAFGNLDYLTHGRTTPGVSLSFPVSKTDMLTFSGFISKGSTNGSANQNLNLFGTSYSTGDFLTATYKIMNLKLSLQDLLFPFPRKNDQRWHVKTLWEVQYTKLTTNIAAPFVPTTDSSGNAVTTTSSGSRSIVYPTLGLEAEYHLTPKLIIEANGSGFTIPHHSTIADAQGSIGYHIGAIELVIADRFYHFKTSTQNAEYFKATLTGPYAALRIYPGQIAIRCVFCRTKTATNNGNEPSPTANSEKAGSPPAGGSSVSASVSAPTAGNETYIRRFAGGATLSVLGLNLVPGASNTVTNSPTVTTMYQTKGASSRIGYGATAQVAVTDHFAVAVSGFLRRMGYQMTTTVGTSTTGLINGVVTTTTTSTILHEDTRARLIDIPLVVRYYVRGRHDKGPHFFVEGGSAWRTSRSIRTSTDFTNASSVLSCCTTTPAQPLHASVFGFIAGAGAQLVDALGIRLVPEVRYTRWMSPVFQTVTTRMEQNEVAAGFTLGF